jgi:serine/threonine protein kinase
LIFEIFHETTPFYDEDQRTMFDNILNKAPEFPRFGHQAATALMSKLFAKNPIDRPDVDEIKTDPFFRGLDWGKVARLEYKPGQFRTVNALEPAGFSHECLAEPRIDSIATTGVPSDFTIPGFSFGPSDDQKLEFRFG